MSSRIAGHLRSNVVGYVAVFIALSGTAYAVDGPLAGQNQVGSADIINGDVQVSDIGQGAVATDEIANGQVKSADIGDAEVKAPEIAGGAVTSAEIAAGAVTSASVLNDNLTGGDVAPNSLKGPDIDESTLSLAGSGASKVVIRGAYLPTGIGTAHCNPGEVATGGGAGADNTSDSYLGRSEPSPNSGVPTGWTAIITHRTDGTPASGSVFALCASP